MTPKFVVVVAFGLLAILALAACGGEEIPPPTPTATPGSAGENTPPPPSPTPTAMPGDAGDSAPRPAPADLQVSLELDREAYGRGEPVGMTLSITNIGEAEVVLTFSDGQRYDFVVVDGEGRKVWRWSADKLFIQILGQETLAPGQSLVYPESWEQTDERGKQVPDGEYTMRGVTVGCLKGTSDCNFETSDSFRIE